MNIAEFKKSLPGKFPPSGLSEYLKALWYDANDNWDRAHESIQDLPDKNAAWIHAYLHRKEGDISNADYWYNKANKVRPSVSLNTEWEELVAAFL